MDFNLDENDPAIELAEETFALSKLQQAEIEIAKYGLQLEAMKSKANALVISDNKTHSFGIECAGQAKAMFRALEKKRKEIIDPAQSFVSTVNAMVKQFTSGFTDIETSLKAKITRYAQEQERKRLEQQRKAKDEANKLQAEINKAAAECDELPSIVVAPVVQDMAKVTRTASGSASLRTTWVFEVTDFAALPDKFKQVDRVAINAEIKAGIRQIPGVRVFEETKTQIRSASIPAFDSLEQF